LGKRCAFCNVAKRHTYVVPISSMYHFAINFGPQTSHRSESHPNLRDPPGSTASSRQSVSSKFYSAQRIKKSRHHLKNPIPEVQLHRSQCRSLLLSRGKLSNLCRLYQPNLYTCSLALSLSPFSLQFGSSRSLPYPVAEAYPLRRHLPSLLFYCFRKSNSHFRSCTFNAGGGSNYQFQFPFQFVFRPRSLPFQTLFRPLSLLFSGPLSGTVPTQFSFVL
jgi:hypothetical protein